MSESKEHQSESNQSSSTTRQVVTKIEDTISNLLPSFESESYTSYQRSSNDKPEWSSITKFEANQGGWEQDGTNDGHKGWHGMQLESGQGHFGQHVTYRSLHTENRDQESSQGGKIESSYRSNPHQESSEHGTSQIHRQSSQHEIQSHGKESGLDHIFPHLQDDSHGNNHAKFGHGISHQSSRFERSSHGGKQISSQNIDDIMKEVKSKHEDSHQESKESHTSRTTISQSSTNMSSQGIEDIMKQVKSGHDQSSHQESKSSSQNSHTAHTGRTTVSHNSTRKSSQGIEDIMAQVKGEESDSNESKSQDVARDDHAHELKDDQTVEKHSSRHTGSLQESRSHDVAKDGSDESKDGHSETVKREFKDDRTDSHGQTKDESESQTESRGQSEQKSKGQFEGRSQESSKDSKKISSQTIDDIMSQVESSKETEQQTPTDTTEEGVKDESQESKSTSEFTEQESEQASSDRKSREEKYQKIVDNAEARQAKEKGSTDERKIDKQTTSSGVEQNSSTNEHTNNLTQQESSSLTNERKIDNSTQEQSTESKESKSTGQVISDTIKNVFKNDSQTSYGESSSSQKSIQNAKTTIGNAVESIADATGFTSIKETIQSNFQNSKSSTKQTSDDQQAEQSTGESKSSHKATEEYTTVSGKAQNEFKFKSTRQFSSTHSTSDEVEDNEPSRSKPKQSPTYRERSPSVTERQPLLKQPKSPRYDGVTRSRSPSISERTPLVPTETEPKKSRTPSFIALSILCVAVIVALVAGFVIPSVVQQYGKAAVTFESGTISIVQFTDTGLQAHVKGVFFLDAEKVINPTVKDLGRAATYIAKEIESYNSELSIYLPEYNETLLGNATIPPIVLNIRNSHRNYIDMIVDVQPGDIIGLQEVAQDFMHGKETLDVAAVATMSIRSGLFNLGSTTVKQLVKVVRGNKTTDFDIESLRISEVPNGIIAKAKVIANNTYPITFDIPSINMDILLPDCSNDYLKLGNMTTDILHIKPGKIHAGATAFMSELPKEITKVCPNSTKSPFDTLVSSYLEGTSPKIFIRGSEQNNAPKWIGEMLKTVIQAPVPPIHHSDMVKNFSLSNVHFSLPATPEGSPVLSAIVNVVVGLPPNMTLSVNVSKVRADSDVYYEGQKMGKLDLTEWQPSNSSKVGDELLVQSIVTNAPLQITDQDVFTKVVEAMVFGKKGVNLGIKASVDVETETALGQFVIRKIPSDGKIFIAPLSPGGFEQKIGKIEVVGSSTEELIMEAHVEVMNPTDYSADIPFFNSTLWFNETRLGYAWGGFKVRPGWNALSMKASWFKGKVQSELLSQYISGYNTSMTVINPEMPGLPTPKMNITIPMPHMFGRFLKDTTMHILSSSATFVLFSPIPMIVTSIRSHAYHNGTDIGTIDYDKAFDVAVGDTETPRLPVDWNTNGGFGLIREALGGTLKLDARAETGVKIGEWEETIWYEAKGLGAKVRL